MNKSPNPNSNGANPHQPGSQQPGDELRQQLWELSYGLLDDEVAVGLRARIKSDPALARLYAEVRLQTDLVAAASRVQDGSLHISAGPDSKAGQAKGKSRDRAHSQKAARGARGPAGWATNWLAVGGTVALLLLLTFGLLRPEVITTDLAKVDAPFFYTIVSTPPAVEGLPQVVELQTYDVRDKGRPEKLDVRLVDGEGRETFHERVQTSEKGRALVELPGDVVHPGSRVEVVPSKESGDASRPVAAELKVAEEQRHTFMLLSTPAAQPGEKVEFSMVDVTENSKRAVLPPTDELMVENRSGEDMVQPMWTADPNSKVINGEWKMPPFAATEGLAMRRSRGLAADVKQKKSEADEKTVAAKDGAAKEQNRVIEKFYLEQPGTDRAVRKESTLERTIVMQKRALETRRNDETLRNAASQPAPKPAEVASATVNGAADKPGQAGQPQTFGANQKPAGDVPTAGKLPGRGPRPDAAPPNAAMPVAPDQAPPAPAPLAPAPVPAAPKVLAPSPPRPSEPANLPAGPKAQATNQSVTTPAPGNTAAGSAPSRSVELADANGRRQKDEAKKALDDRQQEGGVLGKDPQNAELQAAGQLAKQREAAEVPLPGLVPGKPSAATEVESVAVKAKANMSRESHAARSLKLNVEGLQAGYAPGQKVKLDIRVVDEENRPVTANVGVRVWNEKDARASKSPLLLTDALAIESSRELSRVTDAKFEQAAQEFPAQRGIAEAGLAGSNTAAGAGGFGGGAPSGGAGPSGGPQAEVRKGVAEKQDQEALATNGPTRPEAFPPASLGAAAEQPGPATEENRDEPSASPVPVDDQLNEIASSEPVEADNRAQVQRDYELALAAARMQQSDHWQTMGRVLIWSSAGLLVVLGLLMISRQPLRTSVLVPAVALCMACLTVGIAWFVPPQPAGFQIALSPAPPTTAEPGVSNGTEKRPIDTRAFRAESDAAPTPSAESGEIAGSNGEAKPIEAKPIEALKRLENSADAKSESVIRQGYGGVAGPATTMAPADGQKPVSAAGAKPQLPQNSSANRNAGASSPSREGEEGAPRNQAAADKSLAEKSAAEIQEAAKAGSPAPLETTPEKPNARPGTQSGARSGSPSNLPAGAPYGSGSGGGLGGGRSADTSPAPDPASVAAGGTEKKLAQTRQQEQQALASPRDRSGSEDLPAALYWRPLTPIDDSGVITIEFTMPAAESEYRLLIDAIGGGRIGSTQELLICREAK